MILTLLDYDVSLHDLVELGTIFETSPSSLKTDSKYISHCVFDVGGFIGSSCREVSHLSPYNIFSLADPQYFQQNWFHLIWSSDAQDIAVLVLAEKCVLSAVTGSTAGLAGSTAAANLAAVVPPAVPVQYR